MKYLAAYMLLNAAGATPSADAIKKVLSAVSIENIEDEKIEALMAAVGDKTLEELIAEGNEKLAAVPAGGSAAGAGAGAGGETATGEAAAGGEAAAAAAEEEEESDEDMGFGLFD